MLVGLSLGDVKEYSIKVVRKLPIVSAMPDLQADHHQLGLKETLVTVLLATLPLWLGAFAASLVDVTTAVNGTEGLIGLYSEKLYLSVNTGALIIYAAAIISPVLFVAVDDKIFGPGGESRLFPARLSHILFVLAITLISAVFIAIQISGQEMNKGVLATSSLWLFATSVFVFYVAACYKRLTLDPARKISSEEDKQIEEYAAHRRGVK